MKNAFLTAEPWQLFLLFFGLPSVFQIGLSHYLSTQFGQFTPGTVPDPQIMFQTFFEVFKIIPIVSGVFMLIIMIWPWSIATGLQHKVPSEIRKSTVAFKILFFIPILYIIGLISAFFLYFNSKTFDIDAIDPAQIAHVVSLILPAHLFSFFCGIYCLVFTAKTLKMAQVKQKVSFGQYAEEFFLLMFYPIGVWILQPKINKLMEDQEDEIEIDSF